MYWQTQVVELTFPNRGKTKGEVAVRDFWNRWSPMVTSLACGLLIWAGEAIVGIVPLGAHKVVAQHSKAATGLDDPTAEVCILTVVISGLSLMSAFKFKPDKNSIKMTPMTYFFVVLALLALIVGAIMYGIVVTHLGKDGDDYIYNILYIALGASFFMAAEKSILES